MYERVVFNVTRNMAQVKYLLLILLQCRYQLSVHKQLCHPITPSQPFLSVWPSMWRACLMHFFLETMRKLYYTGGVNIEKKWRNLYESIFVGIRNEDFNNKLQLFPVFFLLLFTITLENEKANRNSKHFLLFLLYKYCPRHFEVLSITKRFWNWNYLMQWKLCIELTKWNIVVFRFEIVNLMFFYFKLFCCNDF